MGIVLKNASLVDLNPMNVEQASLRIKDGLIAQRNAEVQANPQDEVVDCGGAVVLPGLVNGHTHLYAALAVGMPPPKRQPQNFLEILKLVWWRLDQALDAEAIRISARIGALDALHCGTTTLIDHHASPGCIAGSLDLIEQGIREVGLRGVLCYETTDRHGPDGREAGLDENRRYMQKYRTSRSRQFAALVGAHALFTLEDQSLEALVRLAEQFSCGIHVHVAEDPCDEDACNEQHQAALIDRLAGCGLLNARNIFAHGTHLEPDAITRINGIGVTLAHNPRSNMNNAVGYAPIGQFTCPVMLGTDGIGEDMFAEAKQAWYISRDAHAGVTPVRIVEMLATAARRASESLDVTLGQLTVGAAADVVITDYIPATPLSTDNIPGHLLFSLDSRHVRDVIIQGRWALRDRCVVSTDEMLCRREGTDLARHVWQRMEKQS